jgi:hypothetical protein
MRELEKIKKERAAAKAKEEAERAAEEDEQREIKNQARGTEDRNKKKEFINDMLRSDFHKKFMVSLRGRRFFASTNARDSLSTSDEVIAPYFLSACIAGVGGPSARFWNFYPGRIRRRGISLTWRSTEGQ